MAATRLDHPVLVSADQIRRREFVTTRRGYDPDQVRSYLEELANQVELMSAMLREARLEADAAVGAASPPTVDPSERLAPGVASLIREADETAERLRLDGRRDAERIMLEARGDAERIRTEAEVQAGRAQAEAEMALHRAREQADRTISGLATRREALVDQLAQMQERLLGVARELEQAIDVPVDVPADGPEWADGDAIAAAEPLPTTSANGFEPVAADPAGDGGDSPELVDLRIAEETAAQREPAPAEVRRIVADDILEGLDDPAYPELWEGTEAIQLDVPDIPPLDLSWGDEDDATGSA
jgi:DivIVA domain-containing protein